MQIKPKDKVVLTDKGNMLRKELEKELIFDFPRRNHCQYFPQELIDYLVFSLN
mgnify:CR=1 FL=1